MKHTVIAAALLATASMVTAAGAATCTVAGKSGASYTVDVAGATMCQTGNDTNQINASTSMFGLTGWMLADKNDDNTAGSPLSFGTAPVNGTKSGEWSILNPAGYGNVFITLKAGNGFGAFLLDAATLMAGTWSTTKDLSHASIYYQGPAGAIDVAPVPVPAAGFLLAGALGTLALRRRKSA